MKVVGSVAAAPCERTAPVAEVRFRELESVPVANAAVVGSPDPERTHIVKAFIVLTPGYQASAALEAELQQYVRGKLAPYEYPKEIEFIDSLPMTTTGKVQRRVLRLREEEKKRMGKA